MNEESTASTAAPIADYADLKAPIEVLSKSIAALHAHAKELDDSESVNDLEVIQTAAKTIDRSIFGQLPDAMRSAESDPATLRRVRHEIRNGLNQIIGLTELIAESELLGGNHDAATAIALLRRSANRLLRLVQVRLADPGPRTAALEICCVWCL